MAKKKAVARPTTSFRIAADLVRMAGQVASLSEPPGTAVDVIDAILRPALTKLRDQTVLKTARGIEQRDK